MKKIFRIDERKATKLWINFKEVETDDFGICYRVKSAKTETCGRPVYKMRYLRDEDIVTFVVYSV